MTTTPARTTRTTSSRPAARVRTAHLKRETAWFETGARTVAGMDEVGRGALAGPVTVGVVVVDATTRRAPRGLTDSKLLAPASREEMVPRVRRWGVAWAVGHASSAEIDEVGIIGGLRLAGRRALATVAAAGIEVDAVLLDGSHDWLSDPQPDLLDVLGELEPPDLADVVPSGVALPGARAYRTLDPASLPAPVPPLGVRTLVKADVQCASVAAASVLAKCERDALMRDLAAEHPAYEWQQNKGYATAAHVRALEAHGPSALHRTSWNLPGVTSSGPVAGEPALPGRAADAGPTRADDGASRLLDGP
ncbi:ribonuclease HII [Luteimicrobium sp. NPDC057192]|uniref:ribonuclease HII n=1 Tax=Luteimicrobium sp. NPDC057192 TaxID=3346042 RepID=UPI00363A8BE8